MASLSLVCPDIERAITGAKTIQRSLADGLKLQPTPPTRTGNVKAELRQLGGDREIGDVAHGDSPAPQITRHLMDGRKPDLGKHPILLRPSRLLLIGKVDGRQVATHLLTAA